MLYAFDITTLVQHQSEGLGPAVKMDSGLLDRSDDVTVDAQVSARAASNNPGLVLGNLVRETQNGCEIFFRHGVIDGVKHCNVRYWRLSV